MSEETMKTCNHQGTVAWNPETEKHQCMTCEAALIPQDEVEAILRMQEQVFAKVTAAIMREAFTGEQADDISGPSPVTKECPGSPTGRHFFSLGSKVCADCGAEAR